MVWCTWAQESSLLSSNFLEKEKNWADAMKLWQAYCPRSYMSCTIDIQSYNSYTTQKKLSSFRQCWKSVTESDTESDPESDPDPTPDLTLFFSDFNECQKNHFFIFFLIT